MRVRVGYDDSVHTVHGHMHTILDCQSNDPGVLGPVGTCVYDDNNKIIIIEFTKVDIYIFVSIVLRKEWAINTSS